MSLMRRLAPFGVWLLFATLAEPAPARAQQIRYGYDDLGRLQWVQDGADVAIYVYDPMGNILQIIRGVFPDPNASIGISAFTPTRGPAGTTSVTIFCRGFSATPIKNQVTFNGAPATVTAASPTQLTATVPSGATTGPIAVTAPAGTGASAQAFTILAAPIVTPGSAELLPKQTQTFSSTQPAQWRVNNVVGGNATVGTITATGTTATYAAPAAVPLGGLVTITAANQDAFTLQATATVVLYVPDLLRSPPVSVARAPGAAAGLLPSPLVSVARAPAPASPSTLPAPLLSMVRAPASISASPLTGPLLATAREPVVTAVQDPASGQPARFPRGTSNQPVRILGAGFTGATAVAFNLTTTPDTNIVVNSFTVDSATQLTANISINAAAAVGFRVARVTAAGATSTAQGTTGNLLEVLP